jgi:hypothetical protein
LNKKNLLKKIYCLLVPSHKTIIDTVAAPVEKKGEHFDMMEITDLLCREKFECPDTIIKRRSNTAIVSLAIPGATYRTAELLQWRAFENEIPDTELEQHNKDQICSPSPTYSISHRQSVEEIVKSIPKVTFPIFTNPQIKPKSVWTNTALRNGTKDIDDTKANQSSPNVLVQMFTALEPLNKQATTLTKNKKKAPDHTKDEEMDYIPSEDEVVEIQVKRKRGRPRKEVRSSSPPKEKRKVGRPRKDPGAPSPEKKKKRRSKSRTTPKKPTEKQDDVPKELPVDIPNDAVADKEMDISTAVISKAVESVVEGSLFKSRETPDEARLEEAIRCLDEAEDMSNGSPVDKSVVEIKRPNKTPHKSKYTFTYLIDTDGTATNITGYGNQRSTNWPITESEIASALKKVNGMTVQNIDEYVTETEVFFDIENLDTGNGKMFAFYINKRGWSILPVINTKASMGILYNSIESTVTVNQLHKQTEMLPCLGKMLIQIKSSKWISNDAKVKIPLNRVPTNDDIRAVMLKCTGEVRDIRIPPMTRQCIDSVVSDRLICAITTMLRNYGYRGGDDTYTYTTMADLVEETHGIYVCYLQRDEKPPNKAEKIAVTNFVVIERLVKLSQERKLYLRTDIPVVLFKVCGNIVMNVTSHDIRCILSNS